MIGGKEVSCARLKLALLQNIMTIWKERYYKRKEAGKCQKCNNPTYGKGILCEECRIKTNEQVRYDRHFLQELGICPRCRKNKIYGSEKQCPECSAKQYAKIIPKREKNREEYNRKHAEWSKRHHKSMIESGICTRCGKRPADGVYKTCGICRAKTRDYKRIKYGKPDRRERVNNGLCYFCDNPVKEGYKVCEQHYQMNMEKLNNDKCRKATEDIKKDMKNYFVGGNRNG